MPTDFGRFADQWWTKDSAMQPLLAMNAVRIPFVTNHTVLTQKNVLDIGCGGGFASESLAELGAKVTAIDADEQLIASAQQHQSNTNPIDYQCLDFLAPMPAFQHKFAIITAFEVVEHIDNLELFVQRVAEHLEPGGWFFLSTITRTPYSWLNAVLFAEYLLRILPVGTHQYRHFIKPSEMIGCLAKYQLKLVDIQAIGYSPLTKKWSKQNQITVNYMLAAQLNSTSL